MKIFLAILGGISLALGILGIFVPLLPTTPFLLLTAALWVRASPKLYGRLIDHPVLGRYIRDFREKRAIPLRVKITSVSLLWATIGYCIFAVADGRLWLQILLAAVAAGVTWHILSYATLRREG